MKAKLLAAVETMQSEIVQLRKILNQHANGKSKGARPRSSFDNNRGTVHLALLIIISATVIIAVSVALRNIL